MQNTSKLLELSAYLVMFCMAVAFLFYSDRTFSKIISSVKNDISKNHVLYENDRTYEEVQKKQTTYTELITSLLGDLDYDVQINDILIWKENYNYKTFDFSIIPESNYIKNYQYDSTGNIVKVIYKS
ncbi:MAG: Competence protein ComGG [Lachnoclostridium sp.]|jgi:hypothetical protein